MDQITKNRGEKFEAYRELSLRVRDDDQEEFIEVIEGLIKNMTDSSDLFVTVRFLTESEADWRVVKKFANMLARKVPAFDEESFVQWHRIFDLIDLKDQDVYEQLGWSVFQKLVAFGTRAQLIVLAIELNQAGLYKLPDKKYFNLIDEKLWSRSPQ